MQIFSRNTILKITEWGCVLSLGFSTFLPPSFASYGIPSDKGCNGLLDPNVKVEELPIPNSAMPVLSMLLLVQNESRPVFIRDTESALVVGKGLVTELRLTPENVIFKIADKEYQTPSIDHLRFLDIRLMSAVLDLKSDLNKLKIPFYLDSSIESLLTAQDQGLRVSFVEFGMKRTPTVGRVTDIRLIDGVLTFKIEGKEYRPTNTLTVTMLGPHVEVYGRTEIMKLYMPGSVKADVADALLTAQEQGYRVSAEEPFRVGNKSGVITDVRVINGELIFKIDGIDQSSFPSVKITKIKI